MSLRIFNEVSSGSTPKSRGNSNQGISGPQVGEFKGPKALEALASAINDFNASPAPETPVKSNQFDRALRHLNSSLGDDSLPPTEFGSGEKAQEVAENTKAQIVDRAEFALEGQANLEAQDVLALTG